MVDLIVQNISHDTHADLSFTVPRGDLESCLLLLRELQRDMGMAVIRLNFRGTVDLYTEEFSPFAGGPKISGDAITKLLSTEDKNKLDEDVELVDPENNPRYEEFWRDYHNLMARNGISPEISEAGPFSNSTASRLAVSVIREVMFCGPILMPL